jgi:thiamine monophosphate kinase
MGCDLGVHRHRCRQPARGGLAEEVALAMSDPDVAECGELWFGLDALGDEAGADLVGEDGKACNIVTQVTDCERSPARSTGTKGLGLLC